VPFEQGGNIQQILKKNFIETDNLPFCLLCVCARRINAINKMAEYATCSRRSLNLASVDVADENLGIF